MSESTAVKQKTLQLTHGQIHLNYTEGSETPVLLLHGVGNSSESFEMLIPHLGSPVIAPDLLGFGKSNINDRNRIKAHAQDMVELMDALNIEEFFIAGNSFGGDIALEMALLVPGRVKGVVSLNGGGLAMDTPLQFRLMLRPPLSTILFSKMIGPSIWKEYIKSLYQSDEFKKNEFLNQRLGFLKQPGRMTALLNNLKTLDTDRTALHTRLSNLKTPAMVIYGENDPEFSVEYGQQLAKAIEGSFEKISGAGHFVHEDQPKAVGSRIQSWIATLR
ncbi:MAG: alpha/beta hydrolase [SAR324 cluster bacterium]|nr:alpha/beta hydrolase [SAR324 cluster bacterium]